MRATLASGLCKCIAHFPTGAVGDEPNRIERLLGRTGRDQHCFPFEIPPLQGQACDHVGDALGLGQAAWPRCPASQQAFLRLDDQVAAAFQDRQILLGGRMYPHIAVHRGRQHHRASESQVGGGKEVVSQPVGQALQQFGGGGRDHQNVVLLGDCVMCSTGARERLFRARGTEQDR